VDALFERYVNEGRLAGTLVVVARRGRLAHIQAVGRMDRAKDAPMRMDAIFRMASMTKPITSVAVMILYEEGRFQLEDPVSWYIPEMTGMHPEASGAPAEGTEEMTIRDLLTHTSGLPRTGEDPRHDGVWEDPDLTLGEIVSRIGQQPLAYSPGSEWRYGRATDVLGYLVEVVSGLPFDRFLDERIFTPLGMRDTGFFVPEEAADRVPAAYVVLEDGQISELWPALRKEEMQPPKAPRGASGLFSTADDYLRFAQMLLNGGELDGARLLSPKTVEFMLMDHLPPGVTLPVEFGQRYGLAGYGFGLGVRVRTDVAESGILGNPGEFGWGGAYGTYFLVDPEEELIAMFFPQIQGSGAFPIRRQFTNAVYQALVR